jgi:signal transduction histidine kinase
VRSIALVQPAAAGKEIALRLQALPGQHDVRSFEDPLASWSDLREFAPDLLLVDAGTLGDETVGTLLLLTRILDEPALVALVPQEADSETLRHVRRLGARHLTVPASDHELARALSLVEQPETTTAAAEVFLDVARGLADEINNPLLFTRGYLQLLRAELETNGDEDVLAQLDSARRGLDRIAASVSKLRLLHRAVGLSPERLPPVDLLPMVVAAHRAGGDGDPDAGDLAIEVPEASARAEVRGEAELLERALEEFCGTARDIAKVADGATLRLSLDDDEVSIEAEFSGWHPATWQQLPRAFEPYYLSRVLSGTSRGLSLFLVQTIVTAHGGRATAHRLAASGPILFALRLPRAAGRPN